MKLVLQNATFIAILAVLIIAIVTVVDQLRLAGASTIAGNDYQSLNVSTTTVGTSSIKSMYGSIGSIVISSTSPVATVGPMLAVYDTASTTIATTSMTAALKFGSVGGVTPPAGTYQFDVQFNNGMYLWVNPSFNGVYTITYR